MQTASAFLLVFVAGSCLASSSETSPEVKVCLHFRAESTILEPDSEKRLDAFAALAIDRGNGKPVPTQYELDVNGVVEKSPSIDQLKIVVGRHRLLFDLLAAKAGIALEYAKSSLSATRTKYISIKGPTIKEPDRPLEICDARIVAYYPVETKPAICGKQFGYCALYCSASSCEPD